MCAAQPANQVLETFRAFLASGFDRCQSPPSRVDRLQDQRRQRRSQFPLTVAQLGKDVLGPVSQPLQIRGTEETARSLDGVNGTENGG